MNITDKHRAGERRPLPAADAADTPGLRFRREPAGGVRDLLRGRGPPLRPDLALPRAASRRIACRPAVSARSAAPSSAAPIPTPGATSRSSSRRSAAGARRGHATATAPSSAASTATPSTARPRSPRRATACTSTGWRSTTTTGGEGEHRGGKGIVLEYRVRSNGCFFTCAYTRNRHKPWALEGGLEGSPNYAEVIRANGAVETYAVVTALEVNENDVIRIHTGNGGGYGDPTQTAARERARRPQETDSSPSARGRRLRPRP